MGVSALNPDIWEALPHVPILPHKHAERLNGHPACDNKGAQRETQSRPQAHYKNEWQTTSKHQHGVREQRDLSIKRALTKIDLSKLRENVSESDDYGI